MCLSDKDKKAQYDQFGFAGPHPGSNGGPGGFQWGGTSAKGATSIRPSSRTFSAVSASAAEAGGAADFFTQRGRSGGRGRRTQPREPVLHDLSVPFETACLGGTDVALGQ